ncbi:MAG: dihydroneopterin aldolase [Verrucomicrobiia bacterium]|jgi:FolB domain-containing protein
MQKKSFQNQIQSDSITIKDLEVFYCVGVPDEERSKPQRLLITIQIYYPFNKAIANDSISEAVDYQKIVDRLKTFGAGRSWKLIETLAADIARFILKEFNLVSKVEVEVKKFIIPQTKHISAKLTRIRENI